MDKITPIDLFTGEIEPDIFAPNPDDYEEHTLIGDSIRGNVGDVVKVHKNDLAILRANKLIADVEGEETPTDAKAQAKAEKEAKAAQAKAEKEAKAAQAKAEADAPAPQAEPAAELAAIPNLADLPGV